MTAVRLLNLEGKPASELRLLFIRKLHYPSEIGLKLKDLDGTRYFRNKLKKIDTTIRKLNYKYFIEILNYKFKATIHYTAVGNNED